MLARWDGCNLGLATGAASGVWVLDIDPQSGGDVKMAGLVAAYGRLPETYTVRTPSGGLHYYFRMPDDFELTNARGKLPIGIDVRGWHGQVVVPPSERADGRYVTLVDVEVVRAPEWLLEMIRPERREPKVADGPDWVPTDVQIDDSRVQAMLAVAVPGELAEFAAAPVGARNTIGFDAACRLIEFVNAGWVDHDSIYRQFQAAGGAADVDGQFPESERERIWTSARRKVGSKAAVLPDVDYLGSLIPFAEFGGAASDFSSAGTGGVPAFVDPGGEEILPAPDPLGAAREKAIQAEMSRLWLREEASRRLRQLQNPEPEIVFLSEDEWSESEPPEPLVEGWLWSGHVTRLFGVPGSGKTFVTVDLAACVSTGRLWHGRRVKRGTVIYFAAEDGAGVRLRLKAWRQRHETASEVVLVETPLTLDQSGAERVKKAILGRFQPGEIALIVLDTQAQVTVGMDENSATEMGIFAAAVKAVCRAVQTTALIVHHAGIKGGRSRGSTSMLGAVDTEMQSARVGRTITLTGEKQKNTPDPEPIIFNLDSFDLDGVFDAFGQPVSSAVLVAAGDPGTESSGIPAFVDPKEAPRKAHARIIVEILRDQFGEGHGGTEADIKSAFLDDSDISWRTKQNKHGAWRRAWGVLTGAGRVGINPGVRGKLKFIEIPDIDDLDPNPDKVTEFGWEILPPSKQGQSG
jgi:hypothetical protein